MPNHSVPPDSQSLDPQDRPLRDDAPYADWYAYPSVRYARQPNQPCQQELMDVWWDVLTNTSQAHKHHHALVNAPTGLGKTAASLAPAIAWQQQKPQRRQIYYVVSTVNQHDNPLKELQAIYNHRKHRMPNISLKVVDLVGRGQEYQGESFCLHPSSIRPQEVCKQSRQKGYQASLPAQPTSWRELLRQLRDEDLCPYHYLQAQMASADVVICDYWWVFDPAAKEIWPNTSRFGNREIALIVDEAHNLIPRVRGRNDVEISKEQLTNLANKQVHPPTAHILKSLADCLWTETTISQPALERGISVADILPFLDTADLHIAQQYWRQGIDPEARSLPVVARILLNLQRDEEQNVVFYTTHNQYYRKDGVPQPDWLHIRRIESTQDLAHTYSVVKASLTLSATLVAPGDKQEELLKLVPQFGLPLQQTHILKAASPFDEANQFWTYDTHASGTHKKRYGFLDYYTRSITEIGKATEDGVTAVFFSSYEFLRQVYDRMPPVERELIFRESQADVNSDDNVFSTSGNQPQKGMSLQDYEQKLCEIKNKSDNVQKRAFLFCVYGGKLAQGANFSNNLIKSVVCVYIPTEMPELFHVQLSKHLWSLFYPDKEPPPISADTGRGMQAVWKDAWVYAYERPAMYQVLQAVGRGIRSLNDRCAFVLLDRRYHEFGWHQFLQPKPYYADMPHLRVRSFHQGSPKRFANVTNEWDSFLFDIGSF